jgi:hypothetical protein
MSRSAWITAHEVDRISRYLADGLTHRQIVSITGRSLGSIANIAQGKLKGKKTSKDARKWPTNETPKNQSSSTECE